MTNQNYTIERYRRGFMNKCAEYGVDPNVLVVYARKLAEDKSNSESEDDGEDKKTRREKRKAERIKKQIKRRDEQAAWAARHPFGAYMWAPWTTISLRSRALENVGNIGRE